MCTGRIDLSFVIRAFAKGADGVIIGGCWPGECHYVTEGNYDALGNMYLCRKLMEHIGLQPERLRLEWIAASEGARFAEVMSDFVRQVRELGPLGQAEGIEQARLDRKLAAAARLVPYMKLVEREKLRTPDKTQEAYTALYQSDEVSRLFDELVVGQLAVSEIMLLLGGGPLSTSELAERLELDTSAVAKHLNSSSSRGLVDYDPQRGSYALARTSTHGHR